MTEWTFISIDKEGRVVINTITKNMVYYSSKKFMIIEPNKNETKFQSVATRFRSPLHPQIKINDFVTLVSIGNQEKVLILAITKDKSQLIKEITKP